MNFKNTDIYKRMFICLRSSVPKMYVNPEIQKINVNSIVDWLHNVDFDKFVDVSESACNAETWALLPNELNQLTRVLA
jgi:hypothetical protein